ncbi:MAG: oxygen-independent coproporphyrinogen III oxidase [Verrucomicrobiae bacterium]|nr:oxygen-independent coproporphyrinogen III oxidase [Verrucomicrobiae bacterium]
MARIEVNLELVRKYNVPGPRYTSFPPATKFTEAISWTKLEPLIKANNETARPLSLYFHIPFCETLCWFCACTNLVTRDNNKATEYIGYVEREIKLIKPLLNPARKVVQLHWGGGSPSFLRPDQIRRLGQVIHDNFTLADDIEAGVEVDPRDLTREHVAAFREIGFNRISIGVQDFNPQVQKAVHRIQPREVTEQSLAWARELGVESVNFDLIYGLPYQTIESFNETLDTVIALRPDRIALFSYAHVPWLKPAQKIFERKKLLPPPELKLQLLKLAVEKLTADDRYVYIGMDHFARPDDELAVAQKEKKLQRNFQGYSTRAGADIYAFGMSSISQIPEAYWQNHKELAGYYAAIDAGNVPVAKGYIMGRDETIRREVIMRIMCDLALDYNAISAKFGISFAEYFHRELEALAGLEADGLIRTSAAGLEVTNTGRLFVRNIAMCFDNTLPPIDQRRHSRTV